MNHPPATIHLPPEGNTFTDPRTGARVRQVTNHPSIHHHPFYYLPAYDDAMTRLFFVSHRTGRPVRLRFVMKDADLFALQFRDQNHE